MPLKLATNAQLQYRPTYNGAFTGLQQKHFHRAICLMWWLFWILIDGRNCGVLYDFVFSICVKTLIHSINTFIVTVMPFLLGFSQARRELLLVVECA